MLYQNRIGVYRMWLCIFVAGIFLGTILMNLGGGLFLGDDGIFSMASLNRIRYLKVDGASFFPYVLRQRIRPFLFLLLVSTTSFGMAAAYILVGWQGIAAGMLITAAVIRFGIKGMLLILAGMFPQYLLLIPACVMMLSWCCQNCSLKYFPGKSVWPLYGNRRRQTLHQGMTLAWILCVLVIACILECYVNPILMTDIVKIF